jgi:hypothetical protein
LQKRGLDYDAGRDAAALEAAWDRANPDRAGEMPRDPAAKRSAADTLMNVGDSVSQFLLDGANPVKRIERQVRRVEQLGEGLADGVRAARELLKPRGIEDVQQAAGMEGYRDEREALERLDKAAGGAPVEPTIVDELTDTPIAGIDQADLDAAAAVEPAAAVEAEETASIIDWLVL